MKVEKIQGGISADTFVERECGSAYHKAILLVDLGSAVEAARAEWEYDESTDALELEKLLVALDDFLKGLSILPDGELTSYRECYRCGGDGGFRDEEVCIECGGSGSVHRELAEG